MEVRVTVEGAECAPAERALQLAVELGLAAPDRPLAFGLQPLLEANLTFVDDERIQELNRDYRGIDAPTDVLSFSQVEGESAFVAPPSGALELGDVLISLETARRQAAELGHALDYELALLAAHGGLHLLGYDHATDPQAAVMNALTQTVLERLGFTSEDPRLA